MFLYFLFIALPIEGPELTFETKAIGAACLMTAMQLLMPPTRMYGFVALLNFVIIGLVTEWHPASALVPFITVAAWFYSEWKIIQREKKLEAQAAAVN